MTVAISETRLGRIGIIVPLFRSLSLTTELVEFLVNEMSIPSQDILIVHSNAEKSMAEYFIPYSYIFYSENIGSSGVFGEGMSFLAKAGFNWAWLLDDDAIPEKNSLVLIKECVNKYEIKNKKLGVVGSVMIDPVTKDAAWNMNSKSDKIRRKLVRDVDHMPYTGMLVNLDVVKEKILPSKKLFFWVDDTEFCLRLKKHNYSLLSVDNSVIYHESPNKVSFILGKRRLVPSVARLYLYYRNTLVTYYFYDSLKKFLFWRLPSIILQILFTAIQDNSKKERLIEIFKGIKDAPRLVREIKKHGW